MTATRDPDQILHAWLEEGPTVLPAPTVRAIEVATRATTQRRQVIRLPWRSEPMTFSAKVLAIAAALALLIGGAFAAGVGRAPDSGLAPSPTPSPSASPRPTSSPIVDPIDVSTWVSYVSSQYGIPINHPAGWEVRPASRDWSFEQDAVFDPRSPAMDSFYTEPSPGAGVLVSAWLVANEPRTPIETQADLEAWVARYCETTNNAPCSGIPERAIALCIERRDCHGPAILVPFESDIQAFLTNSAGEGVAIVAVWRADHDPAVAVYGGGRRLLEAFLSTMFGGGPAGVYPAPTTSPRP